MKIVSCVLVLVLILPSLIFAASKRKINVLNVTYTTANSDTVGIEATIFVNNPSGVDQKIYFDTLKMIVYAYSYFNWPQSFSNTFTPDVIGKWNIGSASGHNMDTGFSASNLTSPATLAPGEMLEIKFYAKPYTNSSPFFGNADFGRQHYASFYGGGMYMGQILLTGQISVEDVSTPGFVVATSSILKPLHLSGSITSFSTEFPINGGRPF